MSSQLVRPHRDILPSLLDAGFDTSAMAALLCAGRQSTRRKPLEVSGDYSQDPKCCWYVEAVLTIGQDC